jgi:hypothetical protein
VDIGGCTLSDDPHTNKFVIANGTSIPRAASSLFSRRSWVSASARGRTIYFRNADGTRVLDAIRFDAQATGLSSGRFPDGAREFIR